jgi:hypothetical protein
MTQEIDPAKLGVKAARRSASDALNGGNGWKKRPIETLTLQSGQKVQVRRPGPDFMLRSGKVARTFSRSMSAIPRDSNAHPGDFLAGLSKDDQDALMEFGRELVCAMVVSPPLIRHPKDDTEVGPDDIGDAFWELFIYAMSGYFNLKVPVGNEEVEVADLTTFREESGIQGDGDHGSEIRPASEQPDGDRGLVASA